MADESTILEYIVRAQDQARGLLEQQVQVLTKMAAGIENVVAATRRQVGVATQSAQATGKQADGMMRLLRTQTELENSNKRTLSAFTAVTNALSSGNKTWAERVGMVKQLDAAVQKNSLFMERYGRQWTDLTAKLRAAGPLAAGTVQDLQRGALAFGATAQEQRNPVKAFGQQQAQQAAQTAKAQAQAAQQAAAAAKQQGDALDQLIRSQRAVDQSNARLVQGFTAVNGILRQGGQISQQTAAGIQTLSAGVTANANFMRQYGQQWTSVVAQMQAGAAVTPQLTKQVQQLGSAFQQTTGQAQPANSALQGISSTATAVSAAVGYLAIQLGQNLVSNLQKAVNEASAFQSTFIGLASISRAFGQDVSAVNRAAQELASDGLISVKDSAVALRNLMMTGFNLEEAVNLAKGFKDIASFNRQASLELGYAVTSATEGIKNQNSLLVDNAGLTKNLSIILKELGLSEQDLGKVSSNATVRMALYNGLLKEMAPMLGDAERLTDTYQGSVARLTVQTQLLYVSIGEKLLPIMQSFNNTISKAYDFLRNGEGALANTARFVGVLTAAFVALSAILLSIISAAGVVAGAFIALGVATGAGTAAIAAMAAATGGVVLALAALTAAVVTFAVNNKDATIELQRTADGAIKAAEGVHRYRDELEALARASATPTKNIVLPGMDKAPAQSVASKEFQDIVNRMKKEFPRLNVDVRNLEAALRTVNAETTKHTLAMLQAESAVTRARLAALGYTGSIEEMRKKLEDVKNGVEEKTTVWQDLGGALNNLVNNTFTAIKNEFGEIKKGIVDAHNTLMSFFGLLGKLPGMETLGNGFKMMWVDIRRGLKSYADDNKNLSADQKKQVEDAINLLEQQEAATRGVSEVQRGQMDDNARIQADQKRFMELTKGQVATTEQYSAATQKLKDDFRLLTQDGLITSAEAARLMKKDIDELWKASQTGVGVSDELLQRLFGLNKAYDRKNRLEQEAEQHALELENRTRLLSRSIVDLQSGVDSNGQKWGLLTSMMRKHGLEFDAQMMRIPGMATLVKELSDRVGLSAAQYELLAQAQRSQFEEQNRVAAGSIKARQAAEEFRDALFEQTQGVNSAHGAWLLLQQDLQTAEGAHLSLLDRVALFQNRYQSVIDTVDVGTDRWHEATAAIREMNNAMAARDFTGGLLNEGVGAEDGAKGILAALEGVQARAAAMGESLSLPQVRFAQEALQGLVDSGLIPVGTTLDALNAKLDEFTLRLSGPDVVAAHLAASLLAYRREITAVGQEADIAGAVLQDKWTEALNIQNEVLRDREIRRLLPEIEAFAQSATIGAEQWAFWNDQLRNFGKGAFEGIREQQLEITTKTQEFQQNLVKFGRNTAEQQIRDAQLSANAQVATLQEASRKIGVAYANMPIFAKAAFAKITADQQDAIKRQVAMTQAQATLTTLEGNPEFNAFAEELRKLLTDIGKASGKELDELIKKFGTAKDRIDAIVAVTAKWRDRLTETNRRLAQSISFIQNIASIIGAIDPESSFLDAAKIAEDMQQVGASIDNIKGKILELKARLAEGDKIKFSDIVELSDFAAQIAVALGDALRTFGDMKSGLSKAVAGFSIGKEIGGMVGAGIGYFFGGPAGAALGQKIGKWGGAAIGAVVGMFKKANWEKIGADVARRFGGAISEELAKQIDATSKTLEGGTKAQRNQRAAALNMMAILEEQGGITARNINKYVNESKTLLAEITSGSKEANQALEQLNGVFNSMVEYMNTSLNGFVDQAMLKFIADVKASGVEVEAVTAFLKEMADAALEAMNAVSGAFTGRFTKATEFIDQIEEMTQKRRELMEQLAEEDEGSAKWNKLTREIAALDKEFEKVKKQAQGLSGMLTDAATNSQERFDRLGRLIGTTFDAAIASGKTFSEALLALRPSLEGMSKAAQEAGYTVSASLQNLIDLSDWAAANEDIAEGIAGLNTLMKSLANQGAVNQQVFNDFGNEAVAQLQDIIASGQTGDNALRLMQPTLQTLWEMQERFGYKTDEATQKLLDEAIAAGTVGEAHMSAQERMVKSIDKVVSRLDVLLNRMFGIPIAADTAEGGVTGATKSMVDGVNAVGDAADDTARRLHAMAQAGIEGAQGMYEGNHGVIYGNSPGGLNDLNDHLNQAINNYYTLGAAGVKASKDMTEAMAKYTDILGDLDNQITEAGLEGEDLAIFRLMMDKAKMIEKFMKDMEGASDDMVNAGLGKIEQLFEIRSRKIGEQAAKAKKDTEQIQKDFSLSAKLFEQTLNFMHNGIQRSVTMKGLLPTATAFSPQKLTRTEQPTMNIPMSGFAEGIMASPHEPRIGVFGEKKPEIGGTVDFMKEALVGALKEAGMGDLGGGEKAGDMIFDFRGSNIKDERAVQEMVERQIVPHLQTLQRRNHRGYRSTTVRSTSATRIKVKYGK